MNEYLHRNDMADWRMWPINVEFFTSDELWIVPCDITQCAVLTSRVVWILSTVCIRLSLLLPLAPL